MNAAIGIDIGGTNVQLALVREDGGVLDHHRLDVATAADADQFLSELLLVIHRFQAETPDTCMVGIGVGSPGANLQTGTIEKAANLPWKAVPIVSFLQTNLDLPVYLTNDANLFAIGEKVFGKAKEMEDFIVITLGTGVGAGIYTNGHLLSGKDGLAGEVGHTIYQRNGRPCKCGKQGCLERYTSATGFLLTVQQLLKENKLDTTLTQDQSVSAKEVAKAALHGDRLAVRAFELTGQILGEALADLAACLNPEAIFLSGGLTKAGELIMEPTSRSFQSNLLAIYPRTIPLLKGSLPEDTAGVLGAAALVWEFNYSSKQPSLI